MAKNARIPHKFKPWIDARKQFQLSNAHVQMARELGLSPKRFAKYSERKNQPWKLPLPAFIESLYEKRYGKTRPDVVLSIEEIAAEHVAKRTARKARQEQDAPTSEVPTSEVPASEVPTSEVPTSEVPASEVPASEVPASEPSPQEQPSPE